MNGTIVYGVTMGVKKTGIGKMAISGSFAEATRDEDSIRELVEFFAGVDDAWNDVLRGKLPAVLFDSETLQLVRINTGVINMHVDLN